MENQNLASIVSISSADCGVKDGRIAMPGSENSQIIQSFFYEKVRELAYYLYVCRGCEKDRALDHWLEAERQMARYLYSDEEDDFDCLELKLSPSPTGDDRNQNGSSRNETTYGGDHYHPKLDPLNSLMCA